MLNWNDSDWNGVYWVCEVGGSAGWGHGQLVTHEGMGLGWMFFKRCTAASVFERWRWDLVTHKASVSEFRSAFTCGCWHKSHHQTACALASLKARRGSLLQAIRSHLTADFHLVFWYLMRKCSFSEHRSMLPSKEDLLGTVFTFILIQVVENQTDPVSGELKLLSSISPLYVGFKSPSVQLHLLLRSIWATLVWFMLLLIHIPNLQMRIFCLWHIERQQVFYKNILI